MKILFLFLFSIISLFLQAQNTLNVNLKDGTKVSYAFADKPKIKFVGERLIAATGKTKAEFTISDIDKFTFEDTKSSSQINELKILNAHSEFLEIYTLEGRLVRKEKLTDKNLSILMSEFPNGTYIIKDGIKNYKIVKR